jgi:hypothetical protein
VVVWEVGESLEGSEHLYRYRLALVIKGDHKHIGNKESDYDFTDIDRLLADSWNDVGRLT